MSEPPTSLAWLTAAQVNDRMGSSVTDPQVLRAQHVIDLYAGVWPGTEEAERVSARDRRCLDMALAQQAVWMPEQIDYDSRVDVKAMAQDGASWTYRDEDSIVLAPLASRALRKLSWKRNRRPVRVGRGARGRYAADGTCSVAVLCGGVLVVANALDHPTMASAFARDTGPWSERR